MVEGVSGGLLGTWRWLLEEASLFCGRRWQSHLWCGCFWIFFSTAMYPFSIFSTLMRVLLDLLLDGHVLPLEDDVLLAYVRICLRGCPSVRLKMSWKCPSGIRV